MFIVSSSFLIFDEVITNKVIKEFNMVNKQNLF